MHTHGRGRPPGPLSLTRSSSARRTGCRSCVCSVRAVAKAPAHDPPRLATSRPGLAGIWRFRLIFFFPPPRTHQPVRGASRKARGAARSSELLLVRTPCCTTVHRRIHDRDSERRAGHGGVAGARRGRSVRRELQRLHLIDQISDAVDFLAAIRIVSARHCRPTLAGEQLRAPRIPLGVL